MNPTQEQLAALAATIVAGGSHKPPEAVAMALEVWREAGEALGAQEVGEESCGGDRNKGGDEMTQLLVDGAFNVSLDMFLGRVVEAHIKRREDLYREFLHHRVVEWREKQGIVTDESVEDEVTRRIERERKEGIFVIDAWLLEGEYEKWRKTDKSRKAHVKAKNAAAAGVAKKEKAKAEALARKDAEDVASKPTAKKSTARKATAKKNAPRRK